jgi:hypothetical protein
MRLIQAKRLERCRRALEDPLQAHRTWTEIAGGWGFSNMTHFSRRFKSAYGVLPSKFRSLVVMISRYMGQRMLADSSGLGRVQKGAPPLPFASQSGVHDTATGEKWAYLPPDLKLLPREPEIPGQV